MSSEQKTGLVLAVSALVCAGFIGVGFGPAAESQAGVARILLTVFGVLSVGEILQPPPAGL